MPTIAIVSQKGGAGKTTLALNLLVAAEKAGAEAAALIDADPQATAAQWGEWRERAGREDPVVTSPPPKIARNVQRLKQMGSDFIVIDTPPHADQATSEAVNVADLALIACRPASFDLDAIRTTAALLKMRDTPAFVVFNGGPPNAPVLTKEAGEVAKAMGLPVCPHVLSQRAAFRDCVGRGLGVLEVPASAFEAQREVRELWGWVGAQPQVWYPWIKENAA